MSDDITESLEKRTKTVNKLSIERRNLKIRKIAFSILLVLIAAFSLYVIKEIYVTANIELTDDAYVQGNLVPISSLANGLVVEILAEHGQYIEEGALLVRLDQTDALINLAQAQNNLDNAVRNVAALYIKAQEAEQEVNLTNIKLNQIKIEASHRQALYSTNAIAKEEILAANTQLKAAEVNNEIAENLLSQSKVQIEGVSPLEHPIVLEAKYNLEKAILNLENTLIKSSVSGVVAERSVQVGQLIQEGQNLFTIVPLEQLWVEANYKETQIKNIAYGQSVEMVADCYGDSVIFKGKISGVRPGTGASFSLLPAENATGNWIKVIQRVPVIISLDQNELKKMPLIMGLSMTVKTIVDAQARFAPIVYEKTSALKTDLYKERLEKIKIKANEYLLTSILPLLPILEKYTVDLSKVTKFSYDNRDN
jgi:membrane fusion protein (multidrug efflux system)